MEKLLFWIKCGPRNEPERESREGGDDQKRERIVGRKELVVRPSWQIKKEKDEREKSSRLNVKEIGKETEENNKKEDAAYKSEEM